jgi:hypothetical protein
MDIIDAGYNISRRRHVFNPFHTRKGGVLFGQLVIRHNTRRPIGPNEHPREDL